jgi:hypothetical protein
MKLTGIDCVEEKNGRRGKYSDLQKKIMRETKMMLNLMTKHVYSYYPQLSSISLYYTPVMHYSPPAHRNILLKLMSF